MSSLDLFGVMDGAHGGAFYHKIPCENYTKDWQKSMEQIGASGWNECKHLFFHPDGHLFGFIKLPNESAFRIGPPPSNPTCLPEDWFGLPPPTSQFGDIPDPLVELGQFSFLFYDPEANLYGVKDDKLFMQPRPSKGEGILIDSFKLVGGSGWSSFKFLFFDPEGILHGVHAEDDTLHKRIPPIDTTDDWLETSTVIGTNWRNFRFLFFMSNGELYGVPEDKGNLIKGSPPTQGIPCDKWLDSSTLIAQGGFNSFKFLMSPIKVILLYCAVLLKLAIISFVNRK